MRAHQRSVLRLAAVVGGSPGDAEDIAQEAFVKAHAALDRYRPERGSFRTWLLAITANQARDHRRASGRRTHYELALRAEQPTGEASDPAGRLVDDRNALVDALRTLPDRQREVVACRYLLDLSEADTAAVLGLSPGTVKSHLSRALAHLRQELATDG